METQCIWGTPALVCCLQWGHRLSAMETRSSTGLHPEVHHPSMGHRLSAMETLQQLEMRLEAMVPSMGPPPFGDGNFGGEYSLMAISGILQWGHRLSAMETAKLLSSAIKEQSLHGATAFRRWKLAAATIGLTPASILQWGHRLSAMETGKTLLAITPKVNLQWGHRLSAMETYLAKRQKESVGHLQWGHRLSAMETRGASSEYSGDNTPSMGPPPFGDGNLTARSRA